MSASQAEKTIIIKNKTVVYHQVGDITKPPLVFLHGLGMPFEIVMPKRVKFFEYFSKDYCVYAPYHPGLYKSEYLDDHWSLDDYVSYVDDFIEALNIQAPLLMGHSFGGRLAMKYASKYSHKLTALVLINPASTFKNSYIFDFSLRYFTDPLVGKILTHHKIPTLLKNQILSYLFGLSMKDIKEDTYLKYAHMGKVIKDGLFNDFLHEMDNIKTPTIIIWAKQDLLLPYKNGQLLEQLINGSKLVLVNGSHNFLYDKAELIHKIVQEELA